VAQRTYKNLPANITDNHFSGMDEKIANVFWSSAQRGGIEVIAVRRRTIRWATSTCGGRPGPGRGFDLWKSCHKSIRYFNLPPFIISQVQAPGTIEHVV
jgi:hypothetical protein